MLDLAKIFSSSMGRKEEKLAIGLEGLLKILIYWNVTYLSVGGNKKERKKQELLSQGVGQEEAILLVYFFKILFIY